ncbi:MAG: class I SAM-dependent methyltransferase, partial [Acidimicrobiales bacterium]
MVRPDDHQRTHSDLRSIPGWLEATDETVLRFVLEAQCRASVTGDLAELGVYMGKSAVLIGDHVQPGETFTVVDLFDAPAGDA